jgi:hypothetical protein
VVLAPVAGVKLVMMLRITRVTVTRRIRRRGERGISRKTIRVRECRDVSGEPAVTNSCAYYFAHEAAGASAPGIPRALT